MIKKYKITLLIFCLFYNFSTVYPTDDKKHIPDETNSIGQIDLIIYDCDDFFENCLEDVSVDDNIIYTLLNKALDNPDFLLPNKNWWLLKLFFIAIIPFFASTNNLVIAVNSQITWGLILATQFAVPLNIIVFCRLLDKLKMKYNQGIKNIVQNIKQNKVNTLFHLANMSLSIYLGYLSTLIDAKSSGYAYSWIFSSFTDSATTINIAYNIGLLLNMLFRIALSSCFFFNLVDEVIHKSGIGYFMKIAPSLKVNDKELNYHNHVNSLKTLVCHNTTKNAVVKSIDYLKSYNLNTTLDVANLQLHCSAENSHKKNRTNIYINLFKFGFILATGAFCAEAFRQVFTSKLILKEFIENYANCTADGSYNFLLKNNQTFICNNIDNCIKNINIDTINFDTADISNISSVNTEGIIANSLKGIAISTNTAALLITLADYIWKIKNKPKFKQTLTASYLQTKNIIPAIISTTLFISGYFYMKNIYDVSIVAKKSNELLRKTHQLTFMSVTASTILVMSATAVTFSRGMSFLVDFTRIIIKIFKK